MAASDFPAGLGLADHPGGDPPLLFVHATGFCKAVWSPVVDELRALGVGNRVVAVDQRGHGDTVVPPGEFDWWDLGRDAAAVAAVLGGPLVGVGHSSGGAALVMAELLAPGTFSALLLVEPIVFPGPFGRRADNPMSAVAERRRPWFADREEALANYRGRGPFAGWDDRALAAYVDGCMASDGDGRWALKCHPADEAEFYRQATAHGAWARLGEVGARAVVVAGRGSDSHPEEFAAAQAARLGDATLVMVEGASHFVPMERPGVVAALVAELLAGAHPSGTR